MRSLPRSLGFAAAHEFEIAMVLVDPAMISHWSALHHHGLTEQIPRNVFVLTTTDACVPRPRNLAGKPLAWFRATPSSRNPVLCGILVYAIRFKHPLLYRYTTLRKRRLGENRGFRPDF